MSPETRVCATRTQDFIIESEDFSFYEKIQVPPPTLCPDCRYKRRFALRPPRKLWHGTCKCDLENHGHQGTCPNEFETCFSPERVEKVFCESCYQKEVV